MRAPFQSSAPLAVALLALLPPVSLQAADSAPPAAPATDFYSRVV